MGIGESICPSNKVSPGGKRSFMQEWELQGDTQTGTIWVNVYAGRNGVTLTSKTFKVEIGKTVSLNERYNVKR